MATATTPTSGAHNGIIVEIGRDNYHAEAVFEKAESSGYTLGKDDPMVQESGAPVTAYVKAEGDTDAESIVLLPNQSVTTGHDVPVCGPTPAAMSAGNWR